VGEDRRRIVVRGKQREIFTQLLVIVSNFHFNKRAQETEKDFVCTPADCYISLKYSSTKFKGDADDNDAGKLSANEPSGVEESEGEYYFDREYVYLSFQAFAAVLLSREIQEQWWPQVKRNFEKASSIPLDVADFQEVLLEEEEISVAREKNKEGVVDDDDDEDDEDDDEIEEEKKRLPKRASKKPSKKRAILSDEESDQGEKESQAATVKLSEVRKQKKKKN